MNKSKETTRSYTKNESQVYHGRRAGAQNKETRYRVEYLHPLNSDVVIQTKTYTNMNDISNDIGHSRHAIGRVLRGTVESKVFRIIDVRKN